MIFQKIFGGMHPCCNRWRLISRRMVQRNHCKVGTAEFNLKTKGYRTKSSVNREQRPGLESNWDTMNRND